jgi:hypothetical protein
MLKEFRHQVMRQIKQKEARIVNPEPPSRTFYRAVTLPADQPGE